jgi:beta-galactosidase
VLIHAERQTLAYRDDFYAGRPAVTVNGFGKGKAWHVASRNDLAFQRDFFAALSRELALPRAMRQVPYRAVAATDGDNARYLFLQNYSAQSHT